MTHRGARYVLFSVWFPFDFTPVTAIRRRRVPAFDRPVNDTRYVQMRRSGARVRNSSSMRPLYYFGFSTVIDEMIIFNTLCNVVINGKPVLSVLWPRPRAFRSDTGAGRTGRPVITDVPAKTATAVRLRRFLSQRSAEGYGGLSPVSSPPHPPKKKKKHFFSNIHVLRRRLARIYIIIITVNRFVYTESSCPEQN